MRKASNLLSRWLWPSTSAIGMFGSSLIVIIMLVTVIDVVGRRIFSKPLSGALELTEFMMIIIVFFSIANSERLKGHISVDIIVSRLHKRHQSIINSIMYILSLGLFGWLTYRLYLYALDIWQSGNMSAILGIPVFPFVFVAAFGCTVLTLMILINLLAFFAEALGK